MNGNILIKPSVQQKFDHVMQSGRILFFSAPCGFGKTVVANALLRKWRTLCLRADAPDFSLQALPDEWDILLIDDFQLLQEQETSQTLCELIRANPARRFVFLSRGVPPAYLTAFQYTGLMTTLEPDDLLFDHEDIRNFFASCKVAVTESEINGILKESIGYPLGVAITARQMSGADGQRRPPCRRTDGLAPAAHHHAALRQPGAIPLLGRFPCLSPLGDGSGIHGGKA